MADRIKGITVVIGGDTTGLDKALQGVNKEISKTQQSLKDVERLLKFDPTNTTLLEQKQRLLGKAIEDNKTKVEALQQQVDNLHVDDDAFAEWQKSLSKINEQITKNQKELDKLNKQKEEFEKSGDVDSDEYRRVQSEIEKTTQKMEDLNKESAETFETLGRPISTDQMDKLQRELIESQEAGKKLNDELRQCDTNLVKVKNAASKISTGAGKISSAMKPVTTAIAGLGAAAVATVPGTEELRSDLSKLDTAAEDNGVAVDAARQAWEDFVVATDEVDSSVEATANLLQAGFDETNLERAMEGITGAYLRFPDTLKIESLADSLQETLATGEATGQFAELLDRLGIGAENFDAQLAKATTDAEKQNLVLQTLADAGLNDTYEAWKKNNEELTANKEANLEFQQALAELAEKIQPILTRSVEKITELLNWFLDLPSGVQTAIAAILGIVGAIGPVAKGISGIADAVGAVTKSAPKIAETFGKVFSKIATSASGLASTLGPVLSKAFSGIGTVVTNMASSMGGVITKIAGFLGPAGIIAVAIIGLIGVFGDQIQAKLEEVDGYLEGVFTKDWTEVFGDTIGGILNGLMDTFEGIWDSLKSVLDGIIDLIRGVFTLDFERAWEGVKEIISGLVTGIPSLIAAPFEILGSVLSPLWDKLKEALSSGWEAISGFFTETIPETFSSAVEGIQNAISSIWDGIKEAFSNGWDAVSNFFTDTIPEAFTSLTEWIESIPDKLFYIAGAIVGELYNLAQSIVSFFTETIPQFIDDVKEWLAGLPHALGEMVGELLGHLYNFGTGLVDFVTEDIPNFVNGVVEWISQLPERFSEWLATTLTAIGAWGASVIQEGITTAQEFFTSIADWVSQLPERVTEWLTNTLTAVGLWGVQMIQQAITTAQNFINNIITFIQQLPGKIYTWLQNALQKVQEWAANLINTARTEIPKFIDTVIGFFMELPGKIFDIGKNIVQGLWDGIQSMAGWIGDKISGWIDSFLQGFQDHAEIHSPSKLFSREVGEPIGEGVEVGILDKLAGMTGAIDRMLTGQVAALGGILAVPAAAGASPVTNNSDYSRTFGGITVNVYGAAGTQAEAADYGKLIGQQAWRAMRARGVT